MVTCQRIFRVLSMIEQIVFSVGQQCVNYVLNLVELRRYLLIY